jgi:hypothetical protein
MSMRRVLFTAALLILVTLPLCAQRRGVASAPRFSSAPRASIRVNPGFGFRGGIGFGRNPRFGVFFGSRPFHHRRFFYPYGYLPYTYYPYGYTVYPYYGLGLQSDLVYSGYTSQPQNDYSAERDLRLQNDVYRLEAELDQMRQEQEQRANQRQYVSRELMQAPRSAKPEPPAPPTVLIFRDGRKIETKNYALAGQTLWIFSEERARKLPLADLDLDATRQANEERGVEFAARPNP